MENVLEVSNARTRESNWNPAGYWVRGNSEQQGSDSEHEEKRQAQKNI